MNEARRLALLVLAEDAEWFTIDPKVRRTPHWQLVVNEAHKILEDKATGR